MIIVRPKKKHEGEKYSKIFFEDIFFEFVFVFIFVQLYCADVPCE